MFLFSSKVALNFWRISILHIAIQCARKVQLLMQVGSAPVGDVTMFAVIVLGDEGNALLGLSTVRTSNCFRCCLPVNERWLGRSKLAVTSVQFKLAHDVGPPIAGK